MNFSHRRHNILLLRLEFVEFINIQFKHQDMSISIGIFDKKWYIAMLFYNNYTASFCVFEVR